MTEYKLVIVGLADFRRDLKALSRVAPRALQRANKQVAEAVAPSVRAAYARQYTQRTGRSRKAIRAVATQTKAGVRIGGKRRPYMLGQEFGSSRFKQFRPWTGGGGVGGGAGSKGRFLYPTIRRMGREIVDIYWAALDREFRKPFPERS